MGLFKSAKPTNEDLCTTAIGNEVTEEMNKNILAEFTNEEVKQALDQMAPSKSPGPDRFTAGFYQQHWDTMGPEVCAAALHFFLIPLIWMVNSTNIALIPK